MKNDKFIIGLIIGIIVPVVAYGVLLGLIDTLYQLNLLEHRDFNFRTLTLVAIGFNIFPMQWFNKRYKINSMRGLIFPTMIYIAIWLYKFYSQIL